MRHLIAALVLSGCAVAVEPAEPVRCSRTAEDAAGTCAMDVGPGYICGGDGFVACEEGTEHCVCVDGECGAATCTEAER